MDFLVNENFSFVSSGKVKAIWPEIADILARTSVCRVFFFSLSLFTTKIQRDSQICEYSDKVYNQAETKKDLIAN